MKFFGLFALILIFSQTVVSAEKKPGELKIAPFEKRDYSMRELVSFLKSKGAALNFEEVPIKWEQGITYQQVLDTIGERQSETLKEREIEWLKMATNAKAEAAEKKEPEILHAIFHYEEARFDFKLEKASDLKSVLVAAIEFDPRYRLYLGKEGKSIAVVPLKNDFRERNILILRPMPIGEAVFKLSRDVMEPNGISHAMIAMGPNGQETYLTTKKEISMSVVDVLVYEALDRFVEEMNAAMDADFLWSIGGYDSSRHFSFMPVKKAKP